MNRGDHFLLCEGMRLLSEGIIWLRIDEFFQQTSIPKSVEDIPVELQKNLENKLDSKLVQEKWKQFESPRSPVLDGFQAFISIKPKQSDRFKYWIAVFQW